MSPAGAETKVWTFDDFQPGADLGTVEVVIDPRRLDLWRRIYGPETDSSRTSPAEGGPPGLLVAAMMAGYIKVIQPRPPGNVHAGQTLAFTPHRVRPGARLSLSFSCLDKVLKRERRWITFGVRVHDGEQLAMRGEISSIWAA